MRRSAAMFFGARALYAPSYLSGFSGLRSLIWGVGWVRLGMMISLLLHAS